MLVGLLLLWAEEATSHHRVCRPVAHCPAVGVVHHSSVSFRGQGFGARRRWILFIAQKW